MRVPVAWRVIVVHRLQRVRKKQTKKKLVVKKKELINVPTTRNYLLYLVLVSGAVAWQVVGVHELLQHELQHLCQAVLHESALRYQRMRP